MTGVTDGGIHWLDGLIFTGLCLLAWAIVYWMVRRNG